MCTKRIDGLEALSKAAPNAKIELTVAEVRRLLAQARSKADAVPEMPRGTRTPSQRDVFQMIIALWPKANIAALAQAFGVSRTWIYRMLRLAKANDPTAELPPVDVTDLETVEEFANFIDEITTPINTQSND